MNTAGGIGGLVLPNHYADEDEREMREYMLDHLVVTGSKQKGKTVADNVISITDGKRPKHKDSSLSQKYQQKTGSGHVNRKSNDMGINDT